MTRRGMTTFGNDNNDYNEYHDQHDDRHPDAARFDHLIEDALARDAEHRPVYDRVRAHAVAQDVSSSGW